MLTLGPYTYDGRTYRAPDGARPVVDLRGVRTDGLSLFAWQQGEPIPSEYRVIAAGPHDVMTEANARILSDGLKLKKQLPSATVAEAIWRLLTDYADPTGEDAPKPLMPKQNGEVEIFMLGQRVAFKAFHGAPPEEFKAAMDMMRRDWKRLKEWCKDSADPTVANRYLATLAKKTTLPHDVISGSRLKEDEPMEPHTSIADNFDGADSGTLGIQLTWTSDGSDWDNASNLARYVRGDDLAHFVEADSNLSTDDHYAQIQMVTAVLGSCGPVARSAIAGPSGYFGWMDEAGNLAIWKVVSGALTDLDTTIGATGGLTQYLGLHVDGSTIRLYLQSVLVETATDTDITGNVRTGMYAQASSGNVDIDNFTAADGMFPAVSAMPWGNRRFRTAHMIRR